MGFDEGAGRNQADRGQAGYRDAVPMGGGWAR